MKEPIIFIIFNRPDYTQKVLESIKHYMPEKLYVIADGPRVHIDSDIEKCIETRKMIDLIDWPCEIHKIYSEYNMGCGHRISSGITEVFTHEERAIILEDDCIPDPSFYHFCEQLLSKYQNDPSIGMISGNNFIAEHCSYPESYHFSKYTNIWGWATWRRSWAQYDFKMSQWPELKRKKWLTTLFKNSTDTRSLTKKFDSSLTGRTWDYQLLYTSLLHHWHNIIPKYNLVENIGFGAVSTHTNTGTSKLNPVHPIPPDLAHPKSTMITTQLDELLQIKEFRTHKNFWRRLSDSVNKRIPKKLLYLQSIKNQK